MPIFSSVPQKQARRPDPFTGLCGGTVQPGCKTWTVLRLLSLVWLIPAVLLAPDAESSAWDVLNKGLGDTNAIKRVQAVTALGAIGPAPHVVDLLEVGLSDKDAMVRQTAAAVLGEMQARRAMARLKQALNDESAEVSFAAAQALWRMGDQSGRDLLWAVLEGERKTGPGMIEGGVRDAKKKLHSPAALAKIGIEQAAGLLGPFSIGVWFTEDLMTDKGATARALSARLLGSDPDPSSRDQLWEALEDKNAAVRAAAARALGERGGSQSIPKLQPLLSDGNDGVRYMAAAALIRLGQPPARRSQKTRAAQQPHK
jgi:HEAT repeat protein